MKARAKDIVASTRWTPLNAADDVGSPITEMTDVVHTARVTTT
jgi:hypothetical protein